MICHSLHAAQRRSTDCSWGDLQGAGEANVTLGIPRLRELLMTAAKSIRTPVMTLPLRPHCSRAPMRTTLANRLRRLRLAEVTDEMEVEETYVLDHHGSPGREYCIRMRLTDPATYPPEAGISFEQVPCNDCHSCA